MNIVLPFVTATILTCCVTPLVIRIAYKFGFVDDPKKRFHPAHTHKGIIPRAGGLALSVGIVGGILLFLPVTKLILGIILGSLLLTAVGLADDRKDINPYVRFFSNALAAAIVVGLGAGIPYVTNPLTGGIVHLDTWRISFELFGSHSILVWADLLAFLWILWTMNIVGWSAGVDGQMPGFVTISAIVLGILSLRFSLADPSQITVTILALVVAGAFLGFLPWNMYPQKIMPGYGGKTLAGFLLALLGILSYGKLGTALLVLGVPMIDAGYTLIRRIGRRKSPVLADRGHLHHRLLDLGWGKRRVALFYWTVSAILGAIALTVRSQGKLFVLLLAVVGIGGFLLWVNYFSQLSKPQGPDSG
ncbi:undecaprenyl/decaprenyl-phosphate alpha-N-acetylglucosaminyl 1-phosphate transferase [Candidatus Gottesmanbacteria bacterium]|nr:undecaprenyl/decaprenyl-phosphate alpha-N-acetylglucosaminyl 1-phosphate transferase [Candidatus Gottesmanbacteria bacterium]